MDASGRSGMGVGEIGSVNGQPVMYQEWMSTYRNLQDQAQQQQEQPITSQQNSQLEDQAFDEMVNQILIQQEQGRRSSQASDEEIQQAARREMITKLEDFLRRRSKIALVVRREDIRNSPGLMEACEILFGDQARQKIDEYFQGQEQAREVKEQEKSKEYADKLSAESHAQNEAHSEALNWT
jgi:glycerol-3-phosphate dehydrogenase